MTKIHLGIDCGSSGAAVALDGDGEILSYLDFGKAKSNWTKELRRLLGLYDYHTITVEEVGSMPGQGLASTFTFGRLFGMVLGMLHGRDLAYELLRPQIWQRLAFFPGLDPRVSWKVKYAGEPKKWAYASAVEYWGEELFVGPRGGIDDGLVDASLIARAGWIKDSLSTYTASPEWERDQIMARKEGKNLERRRKVARKKAKAKAVNL